MRIISGKLKGRQIPVRKNFTARPTTDYAKESLFNILNNYIDFEGVRVLDLFAGTGSISYEFASRGCKEIVCVEKDFRSVEFIKQAARRLQLTNLKVIKSDVFRFLEKYSGTFDVIFADPPYQLEKISDIPKAVFNSNLLSEKGIFILEHGKDYRFNEADEFKELRVYGSVHFSFFEKK